MSNLEIAFARGPTLCILFHLFLYDAGICLCNIVLQISVNFMLQDLVCVTGLSLCYRIKFALHNLVCLIEFSLCYRI